MNTELQKRVEERAVKEYEACGGDEYISHEAAAFIDGAEYADRYWRERIEATRANDFPRESENCLAINYIRDGIRRELLGDEEKK